MIPLYTTTIIHRLPFKTETPPVTVKFSNKKKKKKDLVDSSSEKKDQYANVRMIENKLIFCDTVI